MMGLSAAWLEVDLWLTCSSAGRFWRVCWRPRVFARVVRMPREGKFSTRIMETSAGRALRVVDQPMRGGGWVATFEDITKVAGWLKALISHMAHHDGPTGLANRTELVEKLEKVLAVLPLKVAASPCTLSILGIASRRSRHPWAR